MFVPHVSKIWTKSYGPNYMEFLVFLVKGSFLKPFLQSVDAFLEDVSVAKTIV